jgi:hypothetical protein
MNSKTNILLRHNYIDIPKFVGTSEVSQVGPEAPATIVMNLAYYGRALSVEAYKELTKLTVKGVVCWWGDVERELKNITGDNRKIGDFVVYKNFPKEVLEKSAAEYWLPQILMYWGFPKEFFTQPVEPREKMDKQPKCVVLKLAKAGTTKDIFNSLLKSPARWKDEEFQDVLFLSDELPINLGKLAFKENLVRLAGYMMSRGKAIKINTATDVLRLAAGLSNGDVALREKFKFKSFRKPERKYLLGMLEGCANLSDDMARRPELFKRLMHQLHPFDWNKKTYPRVRQAANELYHDRLETFNAKVEVGLANKDTKVLELLASRPGDFRRRLVHALSIFGNKAVKAFVADEVLDKLTTAQIVALRTYLETVNDRVYRTFPPKGNWTKVQVAAARHVDDKHVKAIGKALGKVLEARLPKVKLDIETINIKLPSNDGEVSPYNRGTVFPIPQEVDFIRTASYWQSGRSGVVWFDNSWNFFDHNWKNLGACCWNAVNFPTSHFFGTKKMVEAAAIFSGDPINTGEMKGRAAQLIDLYPDKLIKAGVRYAVWNILCYSGIPFSQVEDVFAALQWGTGAQEGKLFEPSRCQLSFPLTGDSKTKYIALIDLYSREMVYLDANLKGHVSSAHMNGAVLEKTMPAYMEYIKSLPSVHDLFRESEDKKSDMHILYSDKDVKLSGEKAYVFRQENKDNKFKVVDINSLLTE